MYRLPQEPTLREARERYFETSGFDASGYDADWVRFRLGPIPIAFPNTTGRKAAVPRHDLHHVATGYGTDLAGEGEIGAWEIASGCAGARAALVLDLLVLAPALLAAPRRIYRAFVRGRHTRNLYSAPWPESLLDQPLGALRRELGLDAPAPRADRADRLAFAGCVARVLGLQLLIALVLIGPWVAWLLRGGG